MNIWRSYRLESLIVSPAAVCVRLGSVLVKGCRGLKTQHLYQSHACTGDARVADFDPATCCVFVGNFSEGQGTTWSTPHIALNFCTSKFKYK